MKFYSKKDTWLTLFFVFILLLLPITTLIDFRQEKLLPIDLWISLAVFLMLAGFISWIWFRTYYVIDAEHLIIVSGPLRKTIPLENIIAARASSNPISSPALSLERIKISYTGFKRVLISPKDRKLFLSELEKKCPNARIGDV